VTDKAKESESAIQARILLECGRGGTVLFRQNTARGWVGESTKYQRATQVMVYPGDVVVRNARPLHAGLCIGSPDIVGWEPLVITAEMVGRTVAVFTGFEVKSATGRPTPEQRNFLDRLSSAGGVAALVRSPDEARAALASAGTVTPVA
jgi:hypothetical protein